VNHDYAKPDPAPMAGADILTEAHHLITGPRQAEYSHPFDDYYKVKELFFTMTGTMLTVEQAILFMVCVKLARLSTNMEHGRWKRDTIVDAAGYLGCMSMAHEYRQEKLREVADIEWDRVEQHITQPWKEQS
jgi:hypothetical protein